MFQRISAAAIAVTLFSTIPAAASGSFSCSIEDASLVLNIEGTFSHGLGEALIGLTGEAGIKLPGPPDTLRKLDVQRGQAAQYWLHEKDFRLRLYNEKTSGDVQQSIDVAIVTARKSKDEDDIEFLGTYALEVSHFDPKVGTEAKTWKAKGKASCSAG